MISIAQGKRITKDFEIAGRFYAFDSTTVDLCLNLFWWANFRKTKGGIKIHTLYDVVTQIPLVRSQVKRKWAFSNLVSIIRQQLMNYINIYGFLEDPEGSWREIIKENKPNYQNSLFPDLERGLLLKK